MTTTTDTPDTPDTNRFYISDTKFDDNITLKALSSNSTVSENLNGGQIQTILNGFLYRSLQVVIEHTTMFDDFVAYLIYYLIKVKRRRISYVEKDLSISRLIMYLFTPQTKLRFKLIKSLGIERYYLHRYLNLCESELQTAVACFRKAIVLPCNAPDKASNKQKHIELASVCKMIGIQSTDIQYTYDTLMAYLSCYTQYRQNVISHYYKLCHKKARKQFKDKNNSSLDIDEIYQNYLLAVAKAIDKYDARRGAMTSYINWWILNVNTCDYSSYEYGIAYQIPSSYRRELASHRVNQTNFSVSLDALVSSTSDTSISLMDTMVAENSDHSKQHETNENVSRFRRLIKAVDPTGIARITLGIEEIFTDSELSTMQRHMKFLNKKFRMYQKAKLLNNQ